MAPTGWPPPAAGLQPIRAIGSPPGGRSVCVVCVSRLDAPPHCWSFSTGSPLRVSVCPLRSFVYTTGVLAADKPAPYVCVMRAYRHTFAKTREEEDEVERRERREKTRER